MNDYSGPRCQPASIGRAIRNAANERTSAALKGFCLAIAMGVSSASASPQGGEVVAGQGSIDQSNAATTIINQSSQNLAIDWQSFNVGADELVRFNQPSSSAAALNRIFDQSPSQIFGAVEANGRVFLMNPNGIMFSRGSRVSVGSLFATSFSIGVDDFMNGDYRFEAGENAGMIVNRGLLQAATGGSINLFGGTVSNEGVILARLGTVNLAAGQRVTLDFDGDGLTRFEVDGDVLENVAAADAAVTNLGEIHAEGGEVLLSANAARDVFSRVVNNEGIITATRIDNSGGVIRLLGSGGEVANSGVLDVSAGDAGQSGGEVIIAGDTVEHSGTILADAVSGDGGHVLLEAQELAVVEDGLISSVSQTDGTGGNVEVLGNWVGLFGDAEIDASGDQGGGRVLVGGDFQGANENVRNASRTHVSDNAVIRADAGSSGDGGRVIVWADEFLSMSGAVSAIGGELEGDGGFVEISGRNGMYFNGAVDLSAVNGARGTVLFDPVDIEIANGAGGDGETGTGGVDGVIEFGDVPPTGEPWEVTPGQLEALDADIQLQATNNITLADSLTLASDNSVSFEAGNDINVDAGATLEVSGDGTVNFSAGNDIFINDDIVARDNGTITLIADAAVNGVASNDVGAIVTNNAGDRLFQANGTMTLRAATGIDVVTRNTPDQNTPGNMSIDATLTAAGDITITNDTGDLDGLRISAAPGDLGNLRVINNDANGTLDFGTDVQADSIFLSTFGNIDLDQTLTATTGSVQVFSDMGSISGNGTLSQTTGTMTLRADNGIDVRTQNANNMVIDAMLTDAGDITINNDLGNVDGLLVSAAGDLGNLSVVNNDANGLVDFGADVQADSVLVSTFGNVNLDQSLMATTGSIQVFSDMGTISTASTVDSTTGVVLEAVNMTINDGSVIDGGSGNVALRADDMAIGAMVDIQGTGQVQVTTRTPSALIALGGVDPVLNNQLHLDDMELDRLSANNALVVGETGHLGGITIDTGGISVANDLTLVTDENIDGGSITLMNGSDRLSMTVGGSIGAVSVPLNTSAAIIEANAGTLINISNARSVDNLQLNTGGTASVNTTGTLSTGGNIAASQLTLASIGSMTLGHNLTGANGVTLTSSTGNITGSTGNSVSGQSVTLNAGGSISALNTQTGVLDATAGGAALEIANTGNVTDLRLAAVNGAINLGNTGDINTGADIGAGAITLSATGGAMVLDQNLNATNGSVTLTADNEITQTAAIDAQGDVNVTTNSGSVSMGTTAATTASTGDVTYTANRGAATLDRITSAQDVTLVARDNVALNDVIATSGGGVKITSNTGALTMNSGARTTTSGGNIAYEAQNDVSIRTLDATSVSGTKIDITSTVGDINVNGGGSFLRAGQINLKAETGNIGSNVNPVVVHPDVVGPNGVVTVNSLQFFGEEDANYQLVVQAGGVTIVGSAANTAARRAQSTDLETVAFVDPAIFAEFSLFSVDGLGITLPEDQAEVAPFDEDVPQETQPETSDEVGVDTEPQAAAVATEQPQPRSGDAGIGAGTPPVAVAPPLQLALAKTIQETPQERSATPKTLQAFDDLRGPTWLLDQPASDYSVQIIATFDPDRLRNFIKRNRLETDVAYYVTERSGTDWYVLLYGSYKTRGAASRAVSKLPAAISANQPFARSFGSVQKTIRGE